MFPVFCCRLDKSTLGDETQESIFLKSCLGEFSASALQVSGSQFWMRIEIICEL